MSCSSSIAGSGPDQRWTRWSVIQKEFGIFSDKYTLKQAFRVLPIVPEDFTERRFWFAFLEALKNYVSDREGVSGHDRIVQAFPGNLESDAPLPIYTTTHKLSDDRRILVDAEIPSDHLRGTQVPLTIRSRLSRRPSRSRRGGRRRAA